MYLTEMFKEGLANFLNRKFVRIGNKKILGVVGDHITTRILLNGFYEKSQLSGLKDIFESNRLTDGVMIDVGANIGNHTLYFSDVFKEVVSVEADPEIYAILKLNVELNNVKNCRVVNFALSETDGLVLFQSATKSNLGTGRIVENNCDTIGSKVVVAANGDKLLSELKIDNIKFIKLDVEGHEKLVLKGLKTSIQESKPIIAFESNSEEAYREVATLLNEYGYTKMYALQHPFAAQRKIFRIFLRVFINSKKGWKRISGVNRSSINELVVAVHESVSIKI
jgi:FkbM family methyltransferase